MTTPLLLDTTRSTHEIIEEARKLAFPEPQEVRKFRDYVRGRQKSTYNRQQQKMLRGVTGNLYCDNICRKVIEETANRLELARYEVASSGVSVFLNDLFIKNQMADLSGDVHSSTLRDGNFCVALRWDVSGKRVTLHKERWWNGVDGIFMAYGDDGRPSYAFKDWKLNSGGGGLLRRVIWWPDRIERFIENGNGWQPYYLPEDLGQWPAPWVRRDGTPLGIPIAHFANGSDDDTFYGASELDGGILGLQDDINDSQRNLTIAARMTGAQMVWGSGVKLAKDTSGNPIPLEIGPGVTFNSEDPASRFGVLQAGDLSQLQSAYMTKLQAVARMTNTPMHLITGGNWPSGEALLQATQPLIKKVERLAKTIGPAWATLAHLATELANEFANQGLDENALIQALFSPADKRDPLTQSQIAAGVAPFVSEKEVLRILGYQPQSIEQILKEKKEETAGALAQQQTQQAHQLAMVQAQNQPPQVAAAPTPQATPTPTPTP